MANVNVPPTGPAGPFPATPTGPVNLWQTLASNIGAYVNSKTHLGPKAWGFNALSDKTFCQHISLGAGLDGSAVSAAIVLTQYCKIPKVAVAFATSDVFDGTETFNIVVESSGDYNAAASTPNAGFNTTGTPFGAGAAFGATYTPGVAQTTGPGDNSGTYGYPTQFAAAGTCLFATDIGFGPTFFTGPAASTTAGGSQVFPTTEWDTVYAPGTVLSLRAVTTASTGSITGLCISLELQSVDKLVANDRPQPCYGW